MSAGTLLLTACGAGLLVLGAARADENSNGGTAGALRRVGQGAALMAMGNAGAAFPMGPESRLVNPALIGWGHVRKAGLDWYKLSLDRSLLGVHVSWPLRPMGAFGLSYQRAGVSDIPETTTWGEPTGNQMEASDNLFSFGVALNPARFFALGLNMSVLSSGFSGLDGSTEMKETTAAVDLGLSVRPTDKVWVGLSLQNLGGSLAWDSSPLWGAGGSGGDEDELPVTFTLGLAGEFVQERLLVVADYEATDVDAWDLRGGLEWRSPTTELGRWALRAGWDDGSPALGLGFAWPFQTFEAGLDYAVTFHENDPDEIHTISWRVAF
ncbi:MAG: hypothetical protein WC326_03905 [Candidatus Delongbacteria bacterium]